MIQKLLTIFIHENHVEIVKITTLTFYEIEAKDYSSVV